MFELRDSFWKKFFDAYKKCKQSVSITYLALAYLFTYFASALEAISLGLIVPLLEKVFSDSPISDMGAVQNILDILNLTDTTSIIVAVAIMIFTAVVLKNVFIYLAGWISRVVYEKVNHTFRTKVMNTFMKRDMLFFESKRTGDLTYALGLSGSYSLILTKIQLILRYTFFCLMYGVAMIYISPRITIFIAIAFMPMFFVARALKKKIMPISAKVVDVGSKFSVKSLDILSSMKLIKLYASESEEKKKYEELSDKNRKLTVKLGNRVGLMTLFGEPIMTLGVMLLAGITYFYFVDSTKGGIAGFMTFFVILRRFEWQLQALLGEVAAFAQMDPILTKFLTVFKKEDWMTIKSGTQKFEGLRRNIELKDVSFAYYGSDYVLKNINLKIPKGKMTAFVGTSGGGKTTLAMLLPRLYDCKKGKILYDNIDIKNFDLSTLRRKIGVVSQDVEVISASIRDNLRYGLKKPIGERELIGVTKKAKIFSFINCLPDKFDSMLGEKGTDLSGGQRQRLSIARALLKNPDILILDEATSALDTETEKALQESIDNTLKGKTVIAIAHRLSTIEKADKIVVIEAGQIVEQGTFKQLLKKKGRFHHYWKIQTELS